MKTVFLPLGAALLIAAAPGVQAATIERYAGQTPERLLKSAPAFAKAYRKAVRELDLPAWTKRLAAGQPAEIVRLDGKTLLLTSACSKNGCLDERLYILFDPQESVSRGFFFLPPSPDEPDSPRAAFSLWIGEPDKKTADFLLERAMNDMRQQNQPHH